MGKLKNEKGFTAILTVAILSMVLVTSLMTVYIYVVNRARHYSRVKESYKLMNIMEEAAKSVRSGWDNVAAAAAAPNSGSCCDATYTVTYGIGNTCSTNSWGAVGTNPLCGTGGSSCSVAGVVTTGPATPGCVQDIAYALAAGKGFPVPAGGSWIAGCKGGGGPACCGFCPGGATAADLCIENPDSPTGAGGNPVPYCFYGLSCQGANCGINQQVDFKVLTPTDVPLTITEKFVAKLDGFFEGAKDAATNGSNVTEVADRAHPSMTAPTLFSWLLTEKKALASSGCGGIGQAACSNAFSNGTSMPNCSATYGTAGATGQGTTTSGCVACGPNTLRACAFIYSCPYTFPQCSGAGGGYPWQPGGSTSGQTALFVQEFVLSPPGVCTGGTDPHKCY